MVDHILIERLGDGQLPIYDFNCGEYYCWTGSQRAERQWDIRQGQHRLLLSMDVDEDEERHNRTRDEILRHFQSAAPRPSRSRSSPLV